MRNGHQRRVKPAIRNARPVCARALNDIAMFYWHPKPTKSGASGYRIVDTVVVLRKATLDKPLLILEIAILIGGGCVRRTPGF